MTNIFIEESEENGCIRFCFIKSIEKPIAISIERTQNITIDLINYKFIRYDNNENLEYDFDAKKEIIKQEDKLSYIQLLIESIKDTLALEKNFYIIETYNKLLDEISRKKSTKSARSAFTHTNI
jgi:hypothetical protein